MEVDDHEIIDLSSDDEMSTPPPPKKAPSSASAHVSVVAGAPLDLRALGIGTDDFSSRSPTSSPLQSNGASGNKRTYSDRTMYANRMKSKTNVAYTTQVMPLVNEIKKVNTRLPVRSININQIPKNKEKEFVTMIKKVTPVSVNKMVSNVKYTVNGHRPPTTMPMSFPGVKVNGKSLVPSQIASNFAPIRRAEFSSDEYLRNYMFEAQGDFFRKRDPNDKPEQLFMCTFEPRLCKKVLSSSNEYVSHMWTHVTEPNDAAAWRPAANCDESHRSRAVSDLDKMKTCRICLAQFKTPNHCQAHYNKCHVNAADSKNVCNICEIEFPSLSRLGAHMSIHPFNEAPYCCMRCEYRTTVRSYLIEHFSREHKYEMTVMCPFCVRPFDVPAHMRRRKVIVMPEFTRHMQEHMQKSNNFRCNKCALTFVHESKLNEHKIVEHKNLPSRWTVTRRPLKKANRAVKVDLKKAKDNKKRIQKLQKLYMETLSGTRIDDEVACSSGTERLGFDTTARGTALFICRCGNFQTYSGNRMASHYHRCRKNFKVIDKSVEMAALLSAPPMPRAEEEKEARLFGYQKNFTLSEMESRRQTKKKADLHPDFEEERIQAAEANKQRSMESKLLFIKSFSDYDKSLAEKARELVERMKLKEEEA